MYPSHSWSWRRCMPQAVCLGCELHLVQAAWQAVLLHSSQHSELLGIDSLIMKCGICGSQIMVLILARDTTHWAVRVLSSSSVPAHLPIIHKLA